MCLVCQVVATVFVQASQISSMCLLKLLLLLLLMLYNTQMYIDGLPTTNAGSQKNSNK